MKRLAASFAVLLVSAVASANDGQLARALHESAARAAVGHPGVMVCRQLLVGIVNRDWVRGEVIEVQGHLIAVRIEDPGRFPHILKGVPYFHGAVVWTAPAEWTPCL